MYIHFVDRIHLSPTLLFPPPPRNYPSFAYISLLQTSESRRSLNQISRLLPNPITRHLRMPRHQRRHDARVRDPEAGHAADTEFGVDDNGWVGIAVVDAAHFAGPGGVVACTHIVVSMVSNVAIET